MQGPCEREKQTEGKQAKPNKSRQNQINEIKSNSSALSKILCLCLRCAYCVGQRGSSFCLSCCCMLFRCRELYRFFHSVLARHFFILFAGNRNRILAPKNDGNEIQERKNLKIMKFDFYRFGSDSASGGAREWEREEFLDFIV